MARHRKEMSGYVAAVLALAATFLLGCGHTSSVRVASEAPEEVGIGYGTYPRKNITGAVAVLTADDVRNQPAMRAEEWFEGRVAGAQVLHTPDGGIIIRLRGRSSIYGSSEPLYVVDGMPMRTRPGHGLDWLNPGDIKRIEVLKDAGAAAIYGMRGGNGVVLITTRRGPRRGR